MKITQRIRNINVLIAIVKLSHLINIAPDKMKDTVDVAKKLIKDAIDLN